MILIAEVSAIFPVNVYFFVDNVTNRGFLIDPGAQADELLKIISERGWTIEKILLTHGHFDHIGAVNEIRKTLKIPVFMYKNGADYVKNPRWNLSDQFGLDIIIDDVNFLDDGAEIVLSENFSLKLISTPGHTTDSAIFYSSAEGVAFVGDTIFKGSVGRTDFYGGNEKQLFDTIRTKIFALPDETILLSGHSEPTTVADEKYRFQRFNYFD